ncbi:lipid-binding SYLF domain-containing protein [Salinimicrobium catena]|uniref:lipid-binding SYLF domain-containing protein n=1 Tax=Salinimicrobium catena TaxID=390640 RepID=UPI002FE4523C
MKNLSQKMLPVFLFLLFAGLAGCGSGKTGDDLMNDVREEREMIREKYPNAARMFDEAQGYAIFPNVGKGAYIVGGASGNGAVYENGRHIGYADLKQVDVGFQLGGKAFVEILFFESASALQRFKDGNFELSANASAVLLDEGVSGDIEFQDGIAIVTVPKAGAMAGISVGGQKFDFRPL